MTMFDREEVLRAHSAPSSPELNGDTPAAGSSPEERATMPQDSAITAWDLASAAFALAGAAFALALYVYLTRGKVAAT